MWSASANDTGPRRKNPHPIIASNDLSRFSESALRRAHALPWADRRQRAFRALRPQRGADRSAMRDQTMAQLHPMLAQDDPEKLALDDRRVGAGGQAQSKGQALHVSIDDDPRGDREGGAEHDVRGLAADPRQGGQGVEVTGDLPPMPLDDLLGHRHQVPRLGPEETGRVNQRLEFGQVGLGQGADVGIAGEQRGRHLVDPRSRYTGRRGLSRPATHRRRETSGHTRPSDRVLPVGGPPASPGARVGTRLLRPRHPDRPSSQTLGMCDRSEATPVVNLAHLAGRGLGSTIPSLPHPPPKSS